MGNPKEEFHVRFLYMFPHVYQWIIYVIISIPKQWERIWTHDISACPWPLLLSLPGHPHEDSHGHDPNACLSCVTVCRAAQRCKECQGRSPKIHDAHILVVYAATQSDISPQTKICLTFSPQNKTGLNLYNLLGTNQYSPSILNFSSRWWTRSPGGVRVPHFSAPSPHTHKAHIVDSELNSSSIFWRPTGRC